MTELVDKAANLHTVDFSHSMVLEGLQSGLEAWDKSERCIDDLEVARFIYLDQAERRLVFAIANASRFPRMCETAKAYRSLVANEMALVDIDLALKQEIMAREVKSKYAFGLSD